MDGRVRGGAGIPLASEVTVEGLFVRGSWWDPRKRHRESWEDVQKWVTDDNKGKCNGPAASLPGGARSARLAPESRGTCDDGGRMALAGLHVPPTVDPKEAEV